ncbi:MAG: hypothetical protein H3C47_06615 [Candidatus Cloacimonetes bacterium]|nr:hypothetical protein [Candidatus Cloacimonadota bacterium]
MNQTIKGICLGVLLGLVALALFPKVSHAEWFNSKAPESDSSNLRAIRYHLEDIASSLKEIASIQRQMLDKADK